MKRAAFQPVQAKRARNLTNIEIRLLEDRQPKGDSCPDWCQFHFDSTFFAHFREGVCFFCGMATLNMWEFEDDYPWAPEPSCALCVRSLSWKEMQRIGHVFRQAGENVARVDALRECGFPQPALELIAHYLE